MVDSQPDCGDGLFGPVVFSPCRGGFDFTLLFEQSILTVTPAACFIVLAIPRLAVLAKRPDKVERTTIYGAKIAASSAFTILQLVVLTLVAQIQVLSQKFAIAAGVLDLIVGITIVALSHFEHVKSIRPSFLIFLYLLLSLLFDAAYLRTQWLVASGKALAGVMTASLVVKIVLLVLESIEKRDMLKQSEKRQGLSSESTSGPITRGFFAWLNGLLRQGFATFLTPERLPSIYEKLAADRVHSRFDEVWNKASQLHKHSLFFAVLRCLKWDIAAVIPPGLGVIAASTVQPFLISKAVLFVESRGEGVNPNNGYGLIGATALIFITYAICRSWFDHVGYRATTMLRSGMISLIYQKMMALPLGNVSESGAMSIMGADVETLAETFHMVICDTWSSTLQLAIAIWLLAKQIGAVCIAPLIVSVACTGVTMYMGKYMTLRQKKWLEAIQKRVNFTTEVLGSVKSVKMLGLTDTMSRIISTLRTAEVKCTKSYRYMYGINICILNGQVIVCQTLTFAAYAIAAKLQGTKSLSVNQAITSLSILNLVVFPLAVLIAALPRVFSAFGCLHRIQDFLMQESLRERRTALENRRQSSSDLSLFNQDCGTQLQTIPREDETPAKEAAAITLRHCKLGWTPTSSPERVVDITFPRNAEGWLAMVVGPVGCGKSTFLKGLLGETTQLDGEMRISNFDVAFCDQSAWIINGTIRENIIAQSGLLDEEWYSSVVYACNLDTDFQQLPRGDATLVGSKGVKLSGGQKQRIAIARAVYSRKRIAIFDDVFSALDKLTEQKVFDRVFGRGGLLRRIRCTVILSTHSISRLPEGDAILALGPNGKVVEQGHYNELKSYSGYVANLDISASGTQKKPVVEPETGAGVDTTLDKVLTPTTEAEEQTLQRGANASVWRYYAASLGRGRICLFGGFLVLNSGSGAIRYIWLTWWAEESQANPETSLGYWLGMYGALGVLELLGLSLSCFYIYCSVMPRSSMNLHSVILNAALSAPMSFLSKTETGLLVNRFSQDLQLVDNILPRAVLVTAFQAVDSIAQAGLAIAAVRYIGICFPLLFGILYFIQRFYLRTSKQLRILELELKAPLYSHFIESLNGLVTIRAFGWTSKYFRQTLDLINAAQQPYYLLLCIQRWLVLVLDLIVASLAVLLTTLAVVLRSRVDPGLLGLSLVMMMTLGHTLASLVQFWTELETSLGAIARIKTFQEDTPNEALPDEIANPGPTWPASGALRLENVSLRYSEMATPVVDNISLTIQPGQKVGLVGRTGRRLTALNSGKSSLVLSLLSMIDVSSGTITLDGADLGTIPRSLIRERLSCLTQDPFIFTSSIRLNADPLGQSSDSDIVAALHRVGLWRVIEGKTRAGQGEAVDPLDATLDENFLSHGQRQLFCLARALLKRSSLLILDEPTSSVDSQTDARIQQLLRSELQGCTVIMIAHRLDSLLDFDTVVVLEKGRIIEVGCPRDLLTSVGSAFARMYYASSAQVEEKDLS